MPLQRVGVLKLVNQQVLDARIQPLLHPTRELGVAEHALGGAFHIVHVDPTALTFEGGKLLQQQSAQTRHALLVEPGLVLCAHRQYAQHQVLGVAHLR